MDILGTFDVMLGFDPPAGAAGNKGWITAMSVGGRAVSADLPRPVKRLSSVVAVLSRFAWKGNALDPIQLRGQIGGAGNNALKGLSGLALATAAVECEIVTFLDGVAWLTVLSGSGRLGGTIDTAAGGVVFAAAETANGDTFPGFGFTLNLAPVGKLVQRLSFQFPRNAGTVSQVWGGMR
jgi:hypothetical protein